MRKSDVPFGSEFGPNQVDLARVLELAQQRAGNGDALTMAVAQEYGWPAETAKNTRLGLRAYKLIDKQDRLTEIGQRLLALRSTPDAMYEEFARHILINLRGWDVVQAIDALTLLGEEPTLLTIGTHLKTLGIYVPLSGTHLSKMRGWLQKAGVFADDHTFSSLNMGRAEDLMGMSQSEAEALSTLTAGQQAVLKALCNMPMPSVPDTEPLAANEIMEYTQSLYSIAYNPKNFPHEILEPLVTAGYLTLDKASKATGEEAGNRAQVSGKPTLVYRTAKFNNEYLEPLVDALAASAVPVRELLRKPLSEILEELTSESTYTKGKALELLAFYLMRLLDLEFKGWRKRGAETRGFEVDVIFEGARLIFSRWQIQCKNTQNPVALEDIAKEVGLVPILKSNVIVVVTTSRIGKEARDYAEEMMRISNLNIITLDGKDLSLLTTSPLKILAILNTKARRAMEIKALDKGT